MTVPKQTRLWKTATGETVRVCDMTNEHLVNCIGYLERYAQAEEYQAYRFGGTLRGEASMDAFEDVMLCLEEDGWESFLPEVYYAMVLDKKRREEL